jgi:hypothetical protein
MKKLSKAQIEVLQALAKEDEDGRPVILHFMEGLDAYWFMTGWFKGKPNKTINFSTVETLLKAGVIEKFDTEKFNKIYARITDKGREYLTNQV